MELHSYFQFNADRMNERVNERIESYLENCSSLRSLCIVAWMVPFVNYEFRKRNISILDGHQSIRTSYSNTCLYLVANKTDFV